MRIGAIRGDDRPLPEGGSLSLHLFAESVSILWGLAGAGDGEIKLHHSGCIITGLQAEVGEGRAE